MYPYCILSRRLKSVNISDIVMNAQTQLPVPSPNVKCLLSNALLGKCFVKMYALSVACGLSLSLTGVTYCHCPYCGHCHVSDDTACCNVQAVLLSNSPPCKICANLYLNDSTYALWPMINGMKQSNSCRKRKAICVCHVVSGN
eukprot:6210248-Pleurochrysis_carterae.AAC.4